MQHRLLLQTWIWLHIAALEVAAILSFSSHIMEITLADSDTLRFYRVKGRNTTLERDVVEDYLVLDVPFIDL